MPVKRINWFEQNVEKVAVGVAGAGLLGVLAWQLAGSTTSVEVGNEKDVPLAAVADKLRVQAESLRAQVTAANVDLPEMPVVSVIDAFRARLNTGVEPSKAVLAWSPPMQGIPGLVDSGNRQLAGQSWSVPVVPTPSAPKAERYMVTLAPEDAKLIRESSAQLGKALPEQAPFDLAAVSVETSFDGVKLREALAVKPNKPDGAPIPSKLWDSIAIVRVRYERQELGAGGVWGPASVVGPVPGRFNLDDKLDAKVEWDVRGVSELTSTLAQDKKHAEDVQTPEFYKRAELGGQSVGPDWVPPSESAMGNDVVAQRLTLKRKIRDLDQQIREQQAEITRVQRQPAGGGQGGGAPRGGAPRAPAGGGSGGSGASTPKADPKQEQIKLLEAGLAKLNERREKLVGELKALGPTGTAPTSTGGPTPLLEDAEVRLWTHDLRVQRGKTYRYRAQVWISNPLIGQGVRLDKPDQDAAKLPALVSAFSDWSAPVTVDPEIYAFVYAASPVEGRLQVKGLPTPDASVQIYTFTWGYWWTKPGAGKETLEPGDEMALVARVPDPDAVTKTIAAAKALASAPAPANTPAKPVDPKDKKSPAPVAPVAPTLPGIAAMQREVRLSQPMYLIDVVPAVGSGTGGQRPAPVVYVRSGDSTIMRVPVVEDQAVKDAVKPELEGRMPTDKGNAAFEQAKENYRRFLRASRSAAAGEELLGKLIEGAAGVPTVAPTPGTATPATPGATPGSTPPPGGPGQPGAKPTPTRNPS